MADRDVLMQLNARSSNLDISSMIVDEVDGGRHNASDPDIVGTLCETQCKRENENIILPIIGNSPLICCDFMCLIIND